MKVQVKTGIFLVILVLSGSIRACENADSKKAAETAAIKKLPAGVSKENAQILRDCIKKDGVMPFSGGKRHDLPSDHPARRICVITDFIEYATEQNDAALIKEFLQCPIPKTADTDVWRRSFRNALEYKNLDMIEAFLAAFERRDAQDAGFKILDYDVAEAVLIDGALKLFMKYFERTNNFKLLHEALLWASGSSYHSEHLYGNPDVVRVLLEHGADPNYEKRVAQSRGGDRVDRPLFKALECALARAKASGDLPGSHDNPAENPYMAIVELLLKAGADVTAYNGYGETAEEQISCQRITKNTSLKLLEMVQQYSPLSRMLEKDPKAYYAATSAPADTLYSVMNQFLKNDDVAHLIKLYYGNSYSPVLLAAVFGGNLKRTVYLLDNGFNPNTANKNRKALMHYGAEDGHNDIVEELIARKANINAMENHGDTPLNLACEQGKSEAVQLLLAAKANPNLQSTFTSRDKLPDGGKRRRRGGPTSKYRTRVGGGYENVSSVAGTTPLMHAVMRCDLDIVRDLLAANANVNLKNAENETALDQLRNIMTQEKEEADKNKQDYRPRAEYVEIRKLLEERTKPDAGDGKSESN